jgi:hypothetical protein
MSVATGSSGSTGGTTDVNICAAPATMSCAVDDVRLLEVAVWKQAFQFAEADSRRDTITIDELCANEWSFSFKNHFMAFMGAQHMTIHSRFLPDFTYQSQMLGDGLMEWQFVGPDQSRLQVDQYPYICCSRAADWSWRLENANVVLREIFPGSAVHSVFDHDAAGAQAGAGWADQHGVIGGDDGDDAMFEFDGDNDDAFEALGVGAEVEEEFWHLIGAEHDAAALAAVAAERAHDDDGPPPLVSESDFFALHRDGHEDCSVDSDSDDLDVDSDADDADMHSALAADVDRVRNIDARGAAPNSSSSSDSDEDFVCVANVGGACGGTAIDTSALRPCVGVHADFSGAFSTAAVENPDNDFSRIAQAEERVQNILNEMEEAERRG